jgi:DNA polymerase
VPEPEGPKKSGLFVYASDPTTEIICVAFAVDDGPVQLWWPGNPAPPEWFEAAVNPTWAVHAHNDAFESNLELHKLHRIHGFPLIPPERHRCSMAMCLALGLPAKLGTVANVLELMNRKDAGGEKLMHQMSKPRRARKNEDPNGVYWFEDEGKLQRLGAYCVQDVEVERELDGRLPQLTAAEQAVWSLSNTINARGFHVDRQFVLAARKIARDVGPEIDAELAKLTDGAVTKISQVEKLKTWLQAQVTIDVERSQPQNDREAARR